MAVSTADKSANVSDQTLAAVLPNDGTPWWKRRDLMKLNFCIFSLVLFSSSSGFDGSLVNGLQALSTWQEFMNHPTGAWLGFINAIYWIGTGLSSVAAAWVSNRYGRKLGIWIAYLFLVAGVALQTAAPNDTAFIVARLLIGIGTGWVGNASPLLINEIAYPAHRGITNALFMCGFYVGSVVAAWVTFASRIDPTSWSWRTPSLLQIFLPLVALPGFIVCWESPRWLIAMDRNEEARQVIADAHASGDLDSPLVNYEFFDIQSTIVAEKEAHKNSGYREMIQTPGNRRRLLISLTLGVFTQWSGNGVVSYYLALVLNTIGITRTRDQLLISACLQVWNLIFATVGAVSVDRLGRRMLFMASAVIMLISYVIITALSGSFAQSGSAPVGTAVIPFLFIYFAGYDVALTPMLTAYPCEIWPFRLRSRGLNVTYISAVLAICFNTFINPIALEAIQWKYYIVFVAVLLAYGVTAYFFYPETRGYSLEHMALIFDGDDAEIAHRDEKTKRRESLEGTVVQEEVVGKAV